MVDDLKKIVPPPIPTLWSTKPGWTKYSKNGMVQVPYPDEDAMVFDIETMVKFSNIPVMAVALAKNN
ncbi:MAG: hypothetical protein MHPSP_003255, partial [Paramarteilia canceri]